MRIEIRSDSVVLDGYVNVTMRESRELSSPTGKFVEQILPKTFERALATNPNVDLLFNHDPSRKLGSTVEGNLDLREDNIGLRATATVTDSAVMEKAKNGELQGWSFGFQALKDTWEERADGMKKRSIEEMYLAEISILDKTPAYIATSVECRDDENALTETRTESFTAIIEDNSGNSAKNNDGVEKRDIAVDVDYTIYENEMTLLQLKGASI
jgi:HK97 family phage prohead protease